MRLPPLALLAGLAPPVVLLAPTRHLATDTMHGLLRHGEPPFSSQTHPVDPRERR